MSSLLRLLLILSPLGLACLFPGWALAVELARGTGVHHRDVGLQRPVSTKMKDNVRFLALSRVFDCEPSVLLHRHPLFPSKRDKTGLKHVVSCELLGATCHCVLERELGDSAAA